MGKDSIDKITWSKQRVNDMHLQVHLYLTPLNLVALILFENLWPSYQLVYCHYAEGSGMVRVKATLKGQGH